MSEDQPASADYTRLDDFTLIAVREEVRERLEREPANIADLMRAHHLLTMEVVRRTVAARMGVSWAAEEGKPHSFG
jgi:hypothetical protein